jgi:hypothetical protein
MPITYNAYILWNWHWTLRFIKNSTLYETLIHDKVLASIRSTYATNIYRHMWWDIRQINLKALWSYTYSVFIICSSKFVNSRWVKYAEQELQSFSFTYWDSLGDWLKLKGLSVRWHLECKQDVCYIGILKELNFVGLVYTMSMSLFLCSICKYVVVNHEIYLF